MFIAWSRLSPRTKLLADIVGGKLVFIDDDPPYIRAWSRTKRVLKDLRPRVVVVQLPQGPLLWRVVMLAKLGYRVVADVHTGFTIYASWRERVLNQAFRGMLRRCDLVLAHNTMHARFMVEKGYVEPDKVLVVYDPFIPIDTSRLEPYPGLEPGRYILVPASWAWDEPLEYIATEFLESTASREYQLVIAGDYRRRRQVAAKIKRIDEHNRIVYTGYVTGAKWWWLVANSILVLAATTKEYALLRAIWDAATYNKPTIISATETLKQELGGHPCMFRPGVKGELTSVLEQCLADKARLETTVKVVERLKEKSRRSIEELQRRLSLLAN